MLLEYDINSHNKHAMWHVQRYVARQRMNMLHRTASSKRTFFKINPYVINDVYKNKIVFLATSTIANPFQKDSI